jgi:hypothetical protein
MKKSDSPSQQVHFQPNNNLILHHEKLVIISQRSYQQDY